MDIRAALKLVWETIIRPSVEEAIKEELKEELKVIGKEAVKNTVKWAGHGLQIILSKPTPGPSSTPTSDLLVDLPPICVDYVPSIDTILSRVPSISLDNLKIAVLSRSQAVAVDAVARSVVAYKAGPADLASLVKAMMSRPDIQGIAIQSLLEAIAAKTKLPHVDLQAILLKEAMGDLLDAYKSKPDGIPALLLSINKRITNKATMDWLAQDIARHASAVTVDKHSSLKIVGDSTTSAMSESSVSSLPSMKIVVQGFNNIKFLCVNAISSAWESPIEDKIGICLACSIIGCAIYLIITRRGGAGGDDGKDTPEDKEPKK